MSPTMPLTPLVLIVEDEPKLALLLQDYLHNEQYQTHILSDGNDVVPYVKAESPSLVLLDLMLPNKNGLDISKEIRQFSNIPIIMITARVEEIDRLLGLELGADDYICKPFSPREVVARVKAILRRVHRATENTATEYPHPILFDQEKHEVHLNGHLLDLTPVEFRLLGLLIAKPGKVFSRDALLTNLYDDNRIVTDRTIDAHIKNLRRKLNTADTIHEYIHSIYGVGYKFEVMLHPE